MSYILDALKRAESERSRGTVPTIHAAPAAMLPVPRGAGGRWGAVAGVAVLLIGAAAAAIWWAWPAAPPAPATAPATPSAAAPAPAVPMAANGPASMPAAVSAPPAPTTPAAAVVAQAGPAPGQPASAARAKAPVRKPVEGATAPRAAAPRGVEGKPKPAADSSDRRPRSAEPATASSADRAPTAVAPAAAAVAPAVDLSEERIYSVRELPEAIRTSLPVLTVAGATYSENPASRMLIVNGRLAHEGDAVAPEVTLQQIKLRTAVLSFRGYRYFINY